MISLPYTQATIIAEIQRVARVAPFSLPHLTMHAYSGYVKNWRLTVLIHHVPLFIDTWLEANLAANINSKVRKGISTAICQSAKHIDNLWLGTLWNFLYRKLYFTLPLFEHKNHLQFLSDFEDIFQCLVLNGLEEVWTSSFGSWWPRRWRSRSLPAVRPCSISCQGQMEQLFRSLCTWILIF